MMGQIFQRAEIVLCWFGELSTHRLWALKYLQELAEEAGKYIDLQTDDLEHFWTNTGDISKHGQDTSQVLQNAKAAHGEAIYESEWFERLCIVQEVALARIPKVLCGSYDMTWKQFELATRVLIRCVGMDTLLLTFEKALQLLLARGRYYLITDQWLHFRRSYKRINVGVSVVWLGTCRIDVAKTTKIGFMPLPVSPWQTFPKLRFSKRQIRRYKATPFVPDYTQTVGWAYSRFWRRFGGFTSLLHAGLSRLCEHGKHLLEKTKKNGLIACSSDHYVPSWYQRCVHTSETRGILPSASVTRRRRLCSTWREAKISAKLRVSLFEATGSTLLSVSSTWDNTLSHARILRLFAACERASSLSRDASTALTQTEKLGTKLWLQS
jgi:hypothetical protein